MSATPINVGMCCYLSFLISLINPNCLIVEDAILNRYAPAPVPLAPIITRACGACLNKDNQIIELENQVTSLSDAYATQHQELTALATAYRKLLADHQSRSSVPANNAVTPVPTAPTTVSNKKQQPKKKKKSSDAADDTAATPAPATASTERRSAIRLVKWIPEAAKLPEDPSRYTPKDMATKAANDRGYYMLIGALLTEVFNHFKNDKGGENVHDHNTNMIKDNTLFKLLARVLRQGSNPDEKTKNTLDQNYYLKSLLQEYSHGIKEIVDAREDGVFTINCIRYLWKYTWELISKGITQRVTDHGGDVPDVCLVYPKGSIITQLEFIQVILYPSFATLVPGWIHASSVIKFKCSVRHEFQERVTEAYNLWYSAWATKNNKNMISKVIQTISPVAATAATATTTTTTNNNNNKKKVVVDLIESDQEQKDQQPATKKRKARPAAVGPNDDVVSDDQRDSNQESSSSDNESPDRASNLSSSSSSSSSDDDADRVPPAKRQKRNTAADEYPGSPKYVPVNKDEMASDADGDEN